MRILHIIYDDVDNPWLGGGGALRTVEIYSRIAALGNKVEVLSGNYPGGPRSRMKGGVRYCHVGSTRSYAASRLSFALMCPFLIKQHACDIVIEDVSPFSPVGAPLWKRDVPAVASVQNLSGKHASAKYGLAGWGPRLVERPLLRLFRNFVAVSPGISQEIGATVGPRARVNVIPNSAGDLFTTGNSEPEPSREVNHLLYLGRIDVYQKGLDFLLDVFDLAAGALPGTRLKIAGGGTAEQVERLRSLLAKSKHRERIDLMGQVERAEAADLLRRASALVMPSRYEAWPLTAIEAGAAGIPVLGFDIVGVRDAAPPFPRAHGRLVAQGDVPALAEAIVDTVTNSELRRAMGDRGREWAARFTWESLAQEQLAFYEQLVQESKRRAS